MSTHEDWVDAKKRRDRAAVNITREFFANRTPSARYLADFVEAEAEMDRISKELDEAQS